MTEPPVATDARLPKGERIAKLLARAGVASRREVERMIAEGRVALDGETLDTPATVLPSLRGVTVDGRPVAPAAAARLFAYHKPNGLLVTERDPAGRPTIYDRLPADLPRTMPVGRLDLNTEGLLLLTTDGGLKRQLELPATGVERTYRARAYGEVTQGQLEALIEGVEIGGVRYGSIDANLERRTGANVWIELTLTEGKNREVRHVLEHLGLQVGRLIRTRYGPFVLGDLPVGAVGEVKQHDLVAFAKTLGGARRPRGADLQSLVAVEPRAAARPTAPPSQPPSSPPPLSPPRAPKPAVRAEPASSSARAERPAPRGKAASGWGSRARPARPAAPEREQADAGGRGRARGDRGIDAAAARPLRERPPRDEAKANRAVDRRDGPARSPATTAKRPGGRDRPASPAAETPRGGRDGAKPRGRDRPRPAGGPGRGRR